MRYLLLFFLYFLTLPIAKGKQVKILVIGNSICEYNDMLGLFQNIALLNGKEVKIKATFEGGASIAENICKNLIPGCRIINYKVESPYWFKENKQFSFFIDIFKKYDYVLFQGQLQILFLKSKLFLFFKIILQFYGMIACVELVWKRTKLFFKLFATLINVLSFFGLEIYLILPKFVFPRQCF